jgi:hypothetical protein
MPRPEPKWLINLHYELAEMTTDELIEEFVVAIQDDAREWGESTDPRILEAVKEELRKRLKGNES